MPHIHDDLMQAYFDLTGRLTIASSTVDDMNLRHQGAVLHGVRNAEVPGLQHDGRHTAASLRDDIKRMLDAVGIDADDVNLKVEGYGSFDVYINPLGDEIKTTVPHFEYMDALGVTRLAIGGLARNTERLTRSLILG